MSDNTALEQVPFIETEAEMEEEIEETNFNGTDEVFEENEEEQEETPTKR